MSEMLETMFTGTCKSLGMDQFSANQRWEEIVDAYSGPTRHYHNLKHLERFFEVLFTTSGAQTHEVYMAVFYHDFFYDVQEPPGRNEVNSAQKAQSVLSLDINPKKIDIAQVRSLILDTIPDRKHCFNPQVEEENQLFVDADNAILATNWRTYHQYVLNVRHEYGCYSNEAWTKGRQAFLTSMLKKERIFHKLNDEHEIQARSNLHRELTATDWERSVILDA